MVKKIILKLQINQILQEFKKIYRSQQSVGIGFDVHRLVPKRKLF